MLGIHAKVISHVLQETVEQAVALLKKILEENDHVLSQAVVNFPDHLRFGVPTPATRILAAGGLQHRRAAVALGQSPALDFAAEFSQAAVFSVARRLLDDRDRWLPVMGSLVFQNTLEDLMNVRPRPDAR